jgi:hypothetical protein
MYLVLTDTLSSCKLAQHANQFVLTIALMRPNIE